MPDTGNHDALVDTLLRQARILADEYRDYDPVAARERIAGELEQPRTAAAHRSAATRRTPVAPAHCSSEQEQAVRDLDLAASLVLGAPQAAASLSRLVDCRRRIDPDGALVFACLLHLAGYDEGATFWWRFAAGGGSRTAAQCLYLYHRRHAEFRDADYWRAEAAHLTRSTPRTTRRKAAAHRPLLPEPVRTDLLRQCRRGRHPRLPHALEAVLHRLRIDCDDPDFGEIPQPGPQLAADLNRTA
ncbi:hypothetical protein ACIQGZ_07915 [Streptomyces sp. NPDC092296]|uniref:hypothetical protein n=1 Tax=Streptomyces sp. NPDC092296 TaxID=3366012 RepID=UPI003827FA82